MRLSGLPSVAALLAAALLAGPPGASAVPATPQPAAARPPAVAAAAWPHTTRHDGVEITVYQPQAVAWPDHRTLTARAAVAVAVTGQKAPTLGSVEITLATATDESAGVVHLSDPKLVSTHFPALDTNQAATLDRKLRVALADMRAREVPLASVLLSLDQSPVRAVAVNNEPPAIFSASRPASLLVFDGAPVLAPIGKTGLSYVVNTNWNVFRDRDTWYFLNNGIWLAAAAATGPYKPVGRLPAAFSALPETADFADIRRYVPAHPPKSADLVPTVFASTQPAEIIVTAGPPKFVPVPGTGLQRVENTESTLFFDPAQGRFYVLFSGRWFSAGGLAGPWAFASDRLPPDFAMIPPDSPDGAVLPSVPGTVAAQEAVLKAQIPTTATLKRGGAQPQVIYSGPPHFAPIPGTSMRYAVNTAAIVIEVQTKYYVCQDGAWFLGTAPTGPWMLADSIPPAIRTIPPSFPYYNVTYVDVYAATPSSVTYGYTAGYMMGFVTAGVLVYGTGYVYPPVVLPGRVPIYYPYPYSYAGRVFYNPATGAWARGGTIYGPYATATGGRYYNPTTGAWARGGAVYGPNGGAGAWAAYNPRTGSYIHGSAAWGSGSGSANASFANARTGISGSTNQNWNAYSRWGSSTISGTSTTVQTASQRGARGAAGGFSSSTGAQGVGYHNRATGSSGGAMKGSGGNVYAGRDGNVYRHTDNGWQTWNNGGWNPVQSPTKNGRAAKGAPQTGGRSARTAPAGAHPAARSAPARGSALDRGGFQQLEHDRLGRQAGEGAFGSRFEAGGRFEGGGRVSGGRRFR